MNEKLTPLEAIDECIRASIMWDGGSYSNHHGGDPNRRASLKPGALVDAMPEHVRQSLKQLKGHHFDSMRLDSWRFEDDAYTRKKAHSDMLMKFDKTILK